MMAKLEILSLGSEDVTSGILTQILPVNSMVRAGDVVATVILSPRIETIGSDTIKEDETRSDNYDVEELSVYAPKTGRIMEVFHQIRDPISIGDCLMDIDDADFQADMKVLEEQLQKILGSQEGQPKLPKDYMDTLLKIEDPFRLQTIVQHIPGPLQSQTLPLYERLLVLQKDDLAELSKVHTQIGVVLYKLGDLELTLQHLHKALECRQEALGSDHPQVAATCIHLGALYRTAGDFENSLKYMLQAVEIQEKALGDDHPVVASSYNNIGALHYQTNDFARAIREYEKALNIHLKNKGELDPDTAGTYHNLGVAWKHLGDYNTAQEKLLKALNIRQEQHKQQQIQTSHDDNEQNANTSGPPIASDVAVSHTTLGQLYAEMANFEAAMEQYEAALAIQQQIHGPDSPMTATSHNNIGAVHYETGKYSDALEIYQKALDILRGKEPNHPDAAASWNNVGLTYLKMGEAEKALEHHQEGLQILSNLYGPRHPNLATTIGSIGNVYKAQEQWEKALGEYQIAHELLETALGTSHHPDVASSFNNMGLVLSHLPGREAEALEKYRSACEAFEKSLGSEHPHVGSCKFNIALMLQSQGSIEEAKTEFQAARDIWKTHFGPEHVHVEAAQKGVDECS
ncbi:unnamed protein product [Pseudo-nitzschia multistriata]|uniref:Uncharacterized protein n=1 Tax=Pseudo-nitzschia multistriata TaxID=183589 RepID=A0A448ZE50_9STRA|nr:unnamed protein product [Pseudo-nitzschia multistriata]